MQEPGDEMGYMYDNGDHWMHDIRLLFVAACTVQAHFWVHQDNCAHVL